MAKAKKLPSGNWNTLAYSHIEIIDGKKIRRYESFTAETKREAEYLAAEFQLTKKRANNPENMTLGEATDKYIQSKDGVLSPATIDGYKKIRKLRVQNLMNMKLKDITAETVQNEINAEAKIQSDRTKKTLSPKTIYNTHGLIYSVLETYHPSISLKTHLPAPIEIIKELPPVEDIIEAISGTEIELPCMLAIWLSYTMSEIRGIKTSAIQNNCITIKEVIVDIGNVPTAKQQTKTRTRTRKAQIPKYIMDLIEQQPSYRDYVDNGTDAYLISYKAYQITGRLKRLLKNNGVQHVSFHDLRRMNASIMLMLGIPDKYAMERGGWKTPHVMKKVYQTTFSKERQLVDEKIDAFFNEKMQECKTKCKTNKK